MTRITSAATPEEQLAYADEIIAKLGLELKSMERRLAAATGERAAEAASADRWRLTCVVLAALTLITATYVFLGVRP